MLLVNYKGTEVLDNFAFFYTNRQYYEPQHEISNNVVCATSKGSDQAARKRSLIRAFACRLNIR